MKYIKLFENYDDPLYKEITDEQYSEQIGFNYATGVFNDDFDRYYEDFTNKEITDIYRFFPDSFINKSDIVTTSSGVRYEVEAVIDICRNRPDFSDHNSPYTYNPQITITKLRDSWYIVYDCERSKFYKCDEFEGLITLIKEVLTK